MKIIRSYRLADDGYSVYSIPSRKQAVAQMDDTWGTVYDFIERRKVEGGIPKPIERVRDVRGVV